MEIIKILKSCPSNKSLFYEETHKKLSELGFEEPLTQKNNIIEMTRETPISKDTIKFDKKNPSNCSCESTKFDKNGEKTKYITFERKISFDNDITELRIFEYSNKFCFKQVYLKKINGMIDKNITTTASNLKKKKGPSSLEQPNAA